MTKAFVAGATGLTGREVVRQWRARGLAAVAHVRKDSSRVERWRERFHDLGAEVDTTAWSEAAMAEALRRHAPTHVFALLGTTARRGRAAAGQGRSEESYETVDYGLTVLLLSAALSSGLAPRFVYLSAMGVGPRTRNAYFRVRHRVETELTSSGLPWTVARPSFIVGRRDEQRPLEAAGAAIVDATLGLAGALGARTLRERYRSTSGERLARALVDLALDPTAAGRVVESDELQARARGP